MPGPCDKAQALPRREKGTAIVGTEARYHAPRNGTQAVSYGFPG